MIIFGFESSANIAKRVAKHLRKRYSHIYIDKFPDKELYLKFNENVKGKDVVIIQSFYNNINQSLIETLFACYTAKDLGARKVTLVATYFPYLRQDKMFNKGECVSDKIVARLFDKSIDKIIIINPHMHRRKSLNEIFKIKTHILTAKSLILDYLDKKRNFDVLIGPDEESYQWIKSVARALRIKAYILKKKRFNARKVKIILPKRIDVKDKNIVIIDDIVSTGNTLLETIKLLRKKGAKKITCLVVHGIFLENSLEKLRRYAEIIATNTIPNKVARIDISGLIAENL